MSIKHILLTSLLFISLSMAAQQRKTERTAITNPSEIGTEFPCTLEYGYTIVDSTKVANGVYKINGQNTSKELNETYSLIANASKGRLNGELTAGYTLEGVLDGCKRYLSFSYIGTFLNGLPHGEIAIKSFGQGSSAYDVLMTFKKGVLQGNFKFNAYAKKEIDVVGTFNPEGQMTGEWKFGYYNLLAETAEINFITFSDGFKISGPGYTKKLEAEAKKYNAGKISEAELKKKGIIVKVSTEDGLEDIILSAIRNRFIPFDSMPSIDLSKVYFRYRYLEYFPAIDEEGFDLFVSEIEKYDGYTSPAYASFGIITDDKGLPCKRLFDKTFESHIYNSIWDETQHCEVIFTEEQAEQLRRQLEIAQEKWKKGAVAICNSNYEILIGQQLLGKSSDEISTLMHNAIKRGYKVENEHGPKRYEAYSPIVGFEPGALSAADDNTTPHKYTSIVEIESKDSLGYKTYEWTIPVKNTDSLYICNDLNNSFTPTNFRRVKNDYDTINGLIKVIDNNSKSFEAIAKNTLDNPFTKYSEYIKKAIEINHSDLTASIEQLELILKFQEKFKTWLIKSAEIKLADNKIKGSKKKFADIRDNYNTILEKTDLSWTPSNDLEELIKMEDIQKDILFFIEGSCRFAENNKKIRKTGARYKDMMNRYRKLVKHTELNWSIERDLDKLDSLLNIQERTLVYISKRDTIAANHACITESCNERYPIVEKTYYKYIKNKDLGWTTEVNMDQLDAVIGIQNKTIHFIALRDRIVENNYYIIKKSLLYRQIRHSYKEYIDNASVSWTQDVDLAKLERIIAVQDSYIALLNRDDVKQINKNARKNGLQF